MDVGAIGGLEGLSPSKNTSVAPRKNRQNVRVQGQYKTLRVKMLALQFYAQVAPPTYYERYRGRHNL